MNQRTKSAISSGTQHPALRIVVILAVAVAAPCTSAFGTPQIVRPSADGTLTDGGVYGSFDGAADNWDWTFNQSSYEGAITLSTEPGGIPIEQRVVWEYNLSAVTLQAPITATLWFTLRGAAVYPMPDANIQVSAFPADLVESSADFAAGPALLQGNVTLAAFQPPTVFSVNVSSAVNQALAGNRKVAFRFAAGTGGAATTAQAFCDAADSDVATKPYLSIDAGSAGVPAAALTTAVSRKTNAGASGGFCDLTLLPARKSEPRNPGVSDVRLGFNVTPGVPSGAGITLEQADCASPTFTAYTGTSAFTGAVVGNELAVSFTPPLENARTYRITIGPSVTTIAGQTVEFRGLIGDVNDDGWVNGNDRSVVVGLWTGSGFSCLTDLNGSGATNSADRSVVVGAWTSVGNCAP